LPAGPEDQPDPLTRLTARSDDVPAPIVLACRRGRVLPARQQPAATQRLITRGISMRTLCRLIVLALATSVAPLVVAATTSPAQALPACNAVNEGKVVRERTSFSRGWVIKQLDFDENFTGSPKEMIFELSESQTVRDEVTSSASLSASLKAGAFADLEATAGVEVGHIGETIAFNKTTVKQTFKSGDRYFSARGGMRYRATYKWSKCVQIQSSGFTEYTWNVRRGTAIGYISGRSTLGCKVQTSLGSMARYVQNNYC